MLTASPDESLVDGQVVTVFADADVSSELHAMRARLCRHDANIADAAAFGPGGANCPSRAIGGGQVEAAINLPAGSLVAQLQYAGGTGTANWVSDQGRKQTLTCDAASPCDLVVQLEVPDATVYAALPLQFDAPRATRRRPAPRHRPRTPPRRPRTAAASVAVAASRPRRSRRSHGALAQRGGRAGDADRDDHRRRRAARGMRVFAGGVAGLIGGVLIVLIVARARRRVRDLS